MLLDLIGCLSTPPTGYLRDPAYRGLLDEGERALSEALAARAAAIPDGASSGAAREVVDMLRRLGHGSSAGEEDAPPPDGATDGADDHDPDVGAGDP